MIEVIAKIIENEAPRGGISKEQARIAAEKIGELIAMEWQPIETAPEGDVVLIFDREAFGVSVGQMIAECWSDELNEGHPIFPTHWMRLPPIPNDNMGKSRN